MFIHDFVLNGQGFGDVGATLSEVRFDAGMMRPYFDKNGRPAVTINTGRWTVERGQRRAIREHRLIRDLANRGIWSPVMNATTLRKEEWLELDRIVLTAARYETSAWEDLKRVGVYSGFNAMGKMVLEHETMADPGQAFIDMDGMTSGNNDVPSYQLEGLPLPIVHSDFMFGARKLAASRSSGSPLDTVMGEAAGRRVAETVEGLTIGTRTGPIYGGNSTQVGGYGRTSQVYGFTNFPNRLTKTNLTTPTTSNQATTLAEVLAMRDQLTAQKYRGPFMLYHSNDWDQFMDNDYILTGGNVATQTLRERLKAIKGIADVKRLDMLFGSAPSSADGPGYEVDVTLKAYTLLMVQQTPDVARAVNGMDITTLQWEAKGGMQLLFKVMCIQVPQLRADHYGNCGILHATTS